MGRDRLGFIESIRGLAALVVCLAHYFSTFLPAASQAFMPGDTQDNFPVHLPLVETMLRQTPFSIMFNGQFAVCLFFVLSGFALSIGYFQRGDRVALAAGALKRYPRLVLPIAASLLLGTLLYYFACFSARQVAAITGSAWLAVQYDPARSPGVLVLNALNGILTMSSGKLNPVLWTMKVEFAGSLLVFGFWANVGRARWRWPMAAMVAVLAIVFWRFGALNSLFTVSVLCGSFIARFCVSGRLLPLPASALITLGLFCGCLNYTGMFGGWLPPTAIFGVRLLDVLNIAGSILVVLGVAASPAWRTVLDKPWLRWLGRLSFPLYLVHFPLFSSVGTGIFLVAQPLGYASACWLAFIGWASATFVTAGIFARLADEPAQQAARHFSSMVLARLNKTAQA